MKQLGSFLSREWTLTLRASLPTIPCSHFFLLPQNSPESRGRSLGTDTPQLGICTVGGGPQKCGYDSLSQWLSRRAVYPPGDIWWCPFRWSHWEGDIWWTEISYAAEYPAVHKQHCLCYVAFMVASKMQGGKHVKPLNLQTLKYTYVSCVVKPKKSMVESASMRN